MNVTWPIKYNQDTRDYNWSTEYAPALLNNTKITIDELADVLTNYEVHFPAKSTKIPPIFPPLSVLYKIWITLVFVVIPFVWSVIVIRIISLFIQSDRGLSGLELTFGFLLFLSFNFVFSGLYAAYRRYQNRLDIVDQLDLLTNYLSSSSDVVSQLEEILVEKEGKLYWKSFKLNWDLNDLIPTVTIIDFIALFGAIFNQVYISVWLFSQIIFVQSNGDGFNFAVILVLLIISIFVTLIVLGVKFGRNHLHNFNFNQDEGRAFLQNHLLILIGSTILIFILELIIRDAASIFALIPLFGQIPLFAALVTGKGLYLRQYFHIKSSLIRQLKFERITEVNELKGTNRLNYVETKLQSLQSSSILPTTRLRSYVLIFTALFSIIVPLITALLSSTDRLIDILSLLFF